MVNYSKPKSICNLITEGKNQNNQITQTATTSNGMLIAIFEQLYDSSKLA